MPAGSPVRSSHVPVGVADFVAGQQRNRQRQRGRAMNGLAILLAFFFAAQEAPPASHPRVTRAALVSVEKNFDGRLARAYTPDIFDILGATRGVYLEGCGAVFSTE